MVIILDILLMAVTTLCPVVTIVLMVDITTLILITL
jgi:hypothetical protein